MSKNVILSDFNAKEIILPIRNSDQTTILSQVSCLLENLTAKENTLIDIYEINLSHSWPADSRPVATALKSCWHEEIQNTTFQHNWNIRENTIYVSLWSVTIDAKIIPIIILVIIACFLKCNFECTLDSDVTSIRT